jgi:hypothetical protein
LLLTHGPTLVPGRKLLQKPGGDNRPKVPCFAVAEVSDKKLELKPDHVYVISPDHKRESRQFIA